MVGHATDVLYTGGEETQLAVVTSSSLSLMIGTRGFTWLSALQGSHYAVDSVHSYDLLVVRRYRGYYRKAQHLRLEHERAQIA